MAGNTAASISLVPAYTNCETFEEGDTEVRNNGCEYVFTGDTDENEHAEIHLVCPGANVTEREISGLCTIEVGPQTVTGVHYDNGSEAGWDDITITTTVHGLDFTKTGALCFLVPGDGSNGVHLGEITVTGYEDPTGGKVNISVS